RRSLALAGPRRAEPYPLSLHDALPISNESAEGLRALRYSDEGPLEGAYLYFRPVDGVPAEAIGRLCVCTIQGGEVLLASVRHGRSEEHTSELQSRENLVCRLLPEKKNA